MIQVKAVYYRKGAALLSEENWDGAAEAFAQAGSYADAEAQIARCQALKESAAQAVEETAEAPAEETPVEAETAEAAPAQEAGTAPAEANPEAEIPQAETPEAAPTEAEVKAEE